MKIEAAPIAGYTDQAFRRTLIKCGARVVYTEMVSAAAIYYGNKKSLVKTCELLKGHRDGGRRVHRVVQLFGKDPVHFMAAIKFLQDNGFVGAKGYHEININMGCPANKILKNGEGVALMNNSDLARSIIKACIETATVPVSVKMRLDNVMEIAKICEQEGVAKIIIHGRYGKQGYSGTADWNAIAEVVRAVSIPVIANGDIRSHSDARKCLEITGAVGVMMGRALIGSPWKISCKKLNEKKIIKYHIKQADKCKIYPPEMNKHLLLYRKYISEKI